MHKKFDAAAIEKKWQQNWKENGIYSVSERDKNKEKQYVLVEWPYPSGNLHIGHWHAFAVPDIYVRFLRMNDKQVLYPMGFDAFGLPAENAAIKRNINPREWTENNIEFMKAQLRSMGNAFSWDKTTSSTDENYYKWTQWMFTKFFEHDIAYRGKGTVNWCPGCNTVIANEQVLTDGTCERSGDEIEKKEMPQWMLRITDYADRLVDDLEKLDWPEPIKEAQRRWIGRSEGVEIDFKLSTGDTVTVFTTRPDTLFGATYMVLAPEHELVEKNQTQISNWDEIVRYIVLSKKKAEQDRLDETKEKTGVKLEGITATNPASGEEIPVFIADYVLAGYGTGAIMAVPAHDERDGEFAKKYGIEIKQVVAPYTVYTGQDAPRSDENIVEFDCATVIIKHWSEDKYYVVHFSPQMQGFVGGHVEPNETVKDTAHRETTEESGYSDIKTISLLLEHAYGRGYKTRKSREEKSHDSVYVVELNSDKRIDIVDPETKEGSWMTAEEILKLGTFSPGHKVFFEHYLGDGSYTGDGLLVNSSEFDGLDSEDAKQAITKKVGGRTTNTYRLRDWSVGRQRYWGVPIPIVYDPEGKPHPVPEEHLPWTLPEDVDFRPTGEAPLAKSQELKERTEKIFGEGWTPEVETLDTFVDSSWYFLRYLDNENNESLCDQKRQTEWMPIDIYFGGAEHTTMHLLYSRFWQKALYDLKLATHDEPYQARINRGLILGPDGNKMSKSKGNVIDPDEQVGRVGADSVKMYLAFMGPYGEVANYPWDMGGIAGIRRFLERVYGLTEHIVDTELPAVKTQLHKTISKVAQDIPQYKFNTAISSLMVFINAAEKAGLEQESYETFLKLLAPFAPHLTEELWSELGKADSIHRESFPVADRSLTVDEEVTIGVQVNGKLRGSVTVAADASEAEVLELAKAVPSVSKYLAAGEIKKVIYVPEKILNCIVSN